MAKPLLPAEVTRPMIPRYSRPQMAPIWAPENRFRIWFEIEAHACEAQAAARRHPAERGAARCASAAPSRSSASTRSSARRITTSIAFLTNLAEHVGPEARFVHQGMTSSDVLDTCLAVQLKQAADLLLADLDALLAALKRRAFEHKYTPTIGRSHGIHAEPTTFGLKLAGHYAEFARDRDAARRRARGDRDLRDFRRGRHLRQHRPGGRGLCRQEARPRARADLDPGHPARPPRRSFS